MFLLRTQYQFLKNAASSYTTLQSLKSILVSRVHNNGPGLSIGRSEERSKASVYDVKNSAQIPLDLKILFSFPWITQTRLGWGLPKMGHFYKISPILSCVIPMVLKSCLQTFKDLQDFA